MTAKTYQHVIAIARILWLHMDETRSEIYRTLQTAFPNETLERIGHSIDFTLRLWLFVNVRSPRVPVFIPNRGPSRVWDDDSTLTLKAFVTAQFPAKESLESLSEEQLNTTISHLRYEFTAYNLHYLGGFQIEWTRNIEDHLSMRRSHPRTLSIFPYRSCIKALLKWFVYKKTIEQLCTNAKTLQPHPNTG
jgi:hypothetical protein